MTTFGPVLDARDEGALVRDLFSRAGGYVPGWLPAEGEPGTALVRIYGRYLQSLAERVNQAPDKNRLAFFEMVGVNLLSTRAALAPVVFTPISQVGDARVPAGSQVAAQVPGRDEPLVFETRETIALAAAQLVEVVSLWPGSDGYADHSAAALGAGPFTPFADLKPVPHEFYLAHGTHFHLAGHARVDVQFELSRPGSESLPWAWEFWDGEAWRAFKPFVAPDDPTALPVDDLEGDFSSVDGTAGLTRSGTVRLVTDCAETKPRRINGVESYWVRACLTDLLTPAPGLSLPLVDRITIRSIVLNAGLKADAAFVDGLKLEAEKTFYPFGQQPAPGTTFYLSNAEALSRPGALVDLSAGHAETPQDKSGGTATPGAAPTLSLEYWNGREWTTLQVDDGSAIEFARKGDSLSVRIPRDMEPVAVNGTVAPWLRIRITAGGFYRTNTITWTDTKDTTSTSDDKANTIVVVETVPPALDDFRIGYLYMSPDAAADTCFAYSDFQWADRTADARWRGTSFEPFSLLADRVPTLYLGFDRPLPADLVSLYFDIEEVPGRLRGPLLQWEYFDGEDWLAIAAIDETANLVRPGMVAVTWPGTASLPSGEAVFAEGMTVQLANAAQAASFRKGNLLLIGEPEKGELVTVAEVGKDTLRLTTALAKTYQRAPVAVAMLPRFGRPRTWLRARLQSDGEPVTSRVNGVFLNAAWAEHVRTYQQETIGSSNGDANQAMFIRQAPVLAGEAIEVRELAGARAAVELPMLQQDLAAHGAGEGALRTIADPRSGAITEAWVRWEHRPNLFFSGPGDRHYTIERSRGRVIFGDGVHGRVPPIGADNVRAARYTSGGGVIGNVPAGALKQILSGVPASGATNPRAAEGGADGEPMDGVRKRGALVLRHRNQALSLADYEALAREASPAVAMARALPVTHPSGRPAPGWVKVIVQPHSQDQVPQPTFGLRRQVERYLAARVPAAIAGQVSVTGPDYLPVGVEARLAPSDPFRAGEVHGAVVRSLLAFLHPVTGGPAGDGWPFGRAVFLSDVAAVIERVPGVDYVETLNLLLDGTPRGEFVPIPPDRIVVAGDIRVTLTGTEG
ncbi:MAG: putative baseplate assembly protein [Dehalococcoidia bacterium]